MLLFRNSIRKQTCLGLSVAILLVLCLSLAPPLTAVAKSAVAQGFKSSDTRIVPAALVSLKQTSSDSIELSTADKAGRLVGVVSNSPLVDLSGSGGEVKVVTSGLTMALVSDINGAVAAGDKITSSPIAGVGMKADENTIVIGTVQAGLDGKVQSETRTITDSKGKQQTVRIGLLPMQVEVAYYAADKENPEFVPSFVQSIANNIAGRNVSPLRVLAAIVFLVLVFVGVTSMLYAAVRSSMISIGRNPLSEVAIHKSLLRVGLISMGVLVLSAGITYLILKI